SYVTAALKSPKRIPVKKPRFSIRKLSVMYFPVAPIKI
ncbi:MAG: YSIRK-type signal peptide-containing protein, partial [Megasphaera micronuciformis]|nr:YSIRK-type signal peptide-containing protein [Megasphaera micronuciformis]